MEKAIDQFMKPENIAQIPDFLQEVGDLSGSESEEQR
jgi:hypothetical protein